MCVCAFVREPSRTPASCFIECLQDPPFMTMGSFIFQSTPTCSEWAAIFPVNKRTASLHSASAHDIIHISIDTWMLGRMGTLSHTCMARLSVCRHCRSPGSGPAMYRMGHSFVHARDGLREGLRLDQACGSCWGDGTQGRFAPSHRSILLRAPQCSVGVPSLWLGDGRDSPPR